MLHVFLSLPTFVLKACLSLSNRAYVGTMRNGTISRITRETHSTTEVLLLCFVRRQQYCLERGALDWRALTKVLGVLVGRFLPANPRGHPDWDRYSPLRTARLGLAFGSRRKREERTKKRRRRAAHTTRPCAQPPRPRRPNQSVRLIRAQTPTQTELRDTRLILREKASCALGDRREERRRVR